MTLHKLWNHFAKFPYLEYAELDNWRWLVFRNFDKAIRIMVALSDDLKCFVCKDLSLNYTSEPSLARHLRDGHTKTAVVNCWLEDIAIKSPEEIQGMIDSV